MSNELTPVTTPTFGLAGVRSETWRERVARRFDEIAETRPLKDQFTEEQNRQLMVSDAQFQADKEMLDEIHLMLRMLCERTLQR